MPAVVVLSFDPFVQILGLAIPLRAIGLAIAIGVALLVAAGIARTQPELRRDDLLYLAVGVVPGAVVGGRLFHALAFLDYYARDPAALLDPARGSLSLLGAVIGGTVSAAGVAALVGASARAWLGAAALPLLLAIGLGKLAQLLAGGGQGLPLDSPWAVAFAGPGPWLSSAPSAPAHPSQLYEACWALVGVVAIVVLMSRGWSWSRPLALYGVALSWWLIGRVAIGFTWRDERGLGPLNAEQALAIVTLGVVVIASAFARRRDAARDWVQPSAPARITEPPTAVEPEAPAKRWRGRGKRRRQRERRIAAGGTPPQD